MDTSINGEEKEKMASETKNDLSTFSWTAPQGLSLIGVFVVLALICEVVMVSFFSYAGLTDISLAPLPISPLYHLVPLAVIVVLVSSWIYLTNNIIKSPRRTASPKVSKTRTSRRRHTKRKQTSFTDSITNFFNKIGKALSDTDSGLHGRLSLNEAVFESTVTLLTFFLLSAVILALLAYPRLFADFVVGLYSTTSTLQGIMQGLADALVPIVTGLNSIAIGFSNAFSGLIGPPASLTGADIMLSYVFCQNAAAWISALAALFYVNSSKSVFRR
ncbi:MAG: hypothetical protein NWF03_07960 [Candidatus Bathyarchaeota archaeon]|nr:hypothetical protein [Candidatus Bathyarchaeota archaeon]